MDAENKTARRVNQNHRVFRQPADDSNTSKINSIMQLGFSQNRQNTDDRGRRTEDRGQRADDGWLRAADGERR